MKQSAIAAVIERDLLRSDAGKPSTITVECFSCSHRMRYRGSRFCSDRCREWFDVGNPGYGQPPGTVGSEYRGTSMRPTKDGYMIRCASCQKEFSSKGLRCCSAECERLLRERKDNLAIMAEVGDTPKQKRRCAQCSGPIPSWRNGRRVRQDAQFCSSKCVGGPKGPKPIFQGG
jgi:hypothetical protein